MSNNNTIMRRKREIPGLNLSVPLGEPIAIDHMGERILITLVGHSGRFYTAVFDGPKSFKIERESRGLKK